MTELTVSLPGPGCRYLHPLGRLEHLRELYGPVIAPDSVAQEIAAGKAQGVGPAAHVRTFPLYSGLDDCSSVSILLPAYLLANPGHELLSVRGAYEGDRVAMNVFNLRATDWLGNTLNMSGASPKFGIGACLNFSTADPSPEENSAELNACEAHRTKFSGSDPLAERRGAESLGAHKRVRVHRGLSHRLETKLPPDIPGLYEYLP